MKTLTANATAKATQQFASEPIIIVKLNGRYFSDKVLTLTDITTEDRLMKISDLNWALKQNNVGSVGVISFTLSDHDGSLKTLYDSTSLENMEVTVYQHWQGNAKTDLLTLFIGNIVGPIEWSEGERTLSLEIESKIQDDLLGYEPPKDRYLTDDGWPLAFGNVVHSKALLITKRETANLKTRFKKGDLTFEVIDRKDFPENEQLDVEIDGFIFRGIFSGNIFTVSEYNLPKYENLAFDARPSNDPATDNAGVAWLLNYKSIVNNYILIQDEFGAQITLRVVKQEGKKVFFDSIFIKGSGYINHCDADDSILQVAKHGREGWGFQVRTGSIITTTSSLVDVKWDIPAGTEVKRWDATKPDQYVCNIIPSTIVAVWGTKNGIFKPIPSQYYTKRESYSLEGMSTTVLEFATPLSEIGWDSDVYVTMRSSQGPNIADVIKYLFDTYSHLTTDSASFTSVNTKTTKYPVAFTLYGKHNVVQMCEEIAWQGRCGVIYESNVASIKYLSEEPSSNMTITNDLTEAGTIVLSSTKTEDIVTRFKTTWAETGNDTKQKRYNYENNITTYGTHEREENIFIYNVESLVRKSVDFWGYRYSNPWRTIKIGNFLDPIGIEMFDTLLLNYVSLKGVVTSHKFSIDKDAIDIECLLPAKLGTTTQDSGFWISDAADSTPADPTLKYSEIEKDVEEADAVSKAYGGAVYNQTHPAIVVENITSGALPGDYLVDIYADGYERAVTAMNVPAYILDPNKVHPTAAFSMRTSTGALNTDRTLGQRVNIVYRDRFVQLSDGTEVTYNRYGRFIDNQSATVAEVGPAKVSATGSGYDIPVHIFGNGFDQPETSKDVQVKIHDDANPPPVDTKGYTIKIKDKIYFIPASAATPEKYGISLKKNGTTDNQTVVAGNTTMMTFRTVEFNYGSMQDLANPTRIKIMKAGVYSVSITAFMTVAGPNPSPGVALYRNGVGLYPASLPTWKATSANAWGFNWEGKVNLSLNDYIECSLGVAGSGFLSWWTGMFQAVLLIPE
jgi:hypothetical protein